MAIENAKTLNVRIKNKYDSYENWVASGLILEPGEIAIAYTTVDVKVDNGTAKHPALLMKVGDGEKTFSQLPWMSARAADVLSVCKNETDLKEFINGVIASSGLATDSAMQTLTGKVTTAEGKITVLEGEMDAVEGKAAANEAAIAVLNGLVGDTKVATQIANAIAELNLATTYEAKGEAAKVQTALNEYKNANDAKILEHTNAISANTNAIAGIKDGAAMDSFADVEAALETKEAAGAAAQALVDAKAYADGLAGNYDEKGAAATAETNAKAYADGLAKNYDAAGSAAQALTDAKAYTDAEITEWVGDKKVGVQITEAINTLDLPNTYAAKEHKHVKADITDFAHTHTISEVTGLQDALDGKQAVGDYATKAEAQGYADAKDEAIAAALKAGQDAQGEVDALETYVGVIPEGYTETSVISYINKKAEETLAAASGNSTETAASVKAALDTYKSENDAKVNANTEAVATLNGLVGDETVSKQITDVTDPLAARVKAVEDDYLKAADKTALQEQITTNANAIERLTNGVSAEEVDGVNDLIQYVKDHGTEVTGIKNDIKANADAIDAIEADYLKAADKTELSGLITGLDTRMGAAEGAIALKAAQTDLEALAGRVTTVEGDLNTETTGLKARMTTAEGAIDALEELVGDKKVADQISAAIEALQIGDYAKAADLTAAITQHNTDKAALEASIATKANDADLAAIAKTGSTDDLIQGTMVILFDCGTSAV